ncbi:MAG TPA: helix-turn-helix domain-containing protein, partial [Pseudonocardiaceae bacterium]|nr:helix-turn-helix domain-containing protein [Pseudonocardiaceae bacterium]
MGTEPAEDSSRERILAAAEELFAESGFDATPTSRIAERANVPKGLVHYYFRRKPDLLVALIERLPDAHLDVAGIVVAGDVAASL